MEEMVIGRWLSEAVLSRRWCDVSILCGGRHFWAHRLVLSTASPFIRALLLSRPSDDIPTTIVFADFSYHIVEALLQYIYSGEVSVLPEHVEDFLSLSQALKVHVDITDVKGMNGPTKDRDIIIKSDISDDTIISNIKQKEKNTIDATKIDESRYLNLESFIENSNAAKNSSSKNNLYNNLTKTNSSLGLNYNKAYIESLIVDREKLFLQKSVLNDSIHGNNTKSTVIQNALDYNHKTISLNTNDHNFDTDKLKVRDDIHMNNRTNGTLSNLTNSSILQSMHKIPREDCSILNLTNQSSPPLSANYPVRHHHHHHQESGIYTMTSFLRNEKLVKPIPSLMPIDRLSSNLYRQKIKQTSDILDLSSINRNRKRNSAFEPVNNIPAHSKDFSSSASSNENDNESSKQFVRDEYRNRSNFLHQQSASVHNDLQTIIRTVEEKRDVRTSRNTPQNKVLDSPWLGKGPIFYRRRTKRYEESSEDTSKDSVNQVPEAEWRPTETTGSSSDPATESPPAKSAINDDNNNTFANDQKTTTPPEDAEEDDDACATKCPSCSKMFTSRATLAAHVASHASRARYRCDQCDKSFSQLRNYKYHVSVHKGTKEFAATCNVCGKYFNDRGYLSSHMKIHRNRKEYQCPHCPKSFNQRVAYNMHVRIHTGVKPHQCEACGKAFSRKMLLKQHARTHSGEKPYACSSCGKRFADRSNMTLHMRLHSGVKPFSCNLCPKSFTKKHHLKTHLNYHTGDKPYACAKCGLTFSQSSNMRTHMKKCSATPTSDDSLLKVNETL
ncbi:uncharacterized protein LOC143913740 [Arctopsyche grandis]|uniref:uncharacterized protein LOC143913740 n=1 Tax=Arctopsyche grandis TaxID=121162 RepID=UPI00406D76A0